MKASAKIMYGLTAFLALMAVIYIFATIYVQDDGYLFGAEWVGIVCLILSTGLAIMLGGYFHFTERRTDILQKTGRKRRSLIRPACWASLAPTPSGPSPCPWPSWSWAWA